MFEMDDECKIVKNYDWLKNKIFVAATSVGWTERSQPRTYGGLCGLRDTSLYVLSFYLGAFYRYLNPLISSRSSVSAVTENGVILTDSLDKANTFNRYFSSVRKIDNGFTPQCNDVEINETLECVTVDEADVMLAIAKLKCSLSAATDNLAATSII